jgi:hypothetical protein
MSLDGLRAWIGLVERKLTMRTRVFLVLVAIAVGGAGASIYLAIEAGNEAISESDLRAVRDELAGTAPEGAPETAQLQAEIETLRSEIAALRSAGEVKPETGAAKPNGEDGNATAPQGQQLKEGGEEAVEKAGK